MNIKVLETKKYGITFYVAVFGNRYTTAMSYDGALTQMKNLLKVQKC